MRTNSGNMSNIQTDLFPGNGRYDIWYFFPPCAKVPGLVILIWFLVISCNFTGELSSAEAIYLSALFGHYAVITFLVAVLAL